MRTGHLAYAVFLVCGDRWPFGPVVRAESAVHRALRSIPRRVAWLLPRSVVMWAVVRASTSSLDYLRADGTDTVNDVLSVWEGLGRSS